MQNRTRSLPVPTLGRMVMYAGYVPGQNHPVRMLGTVIAAPDNPDWNTPVTLEVVAPNGERSIIPDVSCSPTPDLPQAGSFTWPAHTPNQDVSIGADGYALGRAELVKERELTQRADSAPVEELAHHAGGTDQRADKAIGGSLGSTDSPQPTSRR